MHALSFLIAGALFVGPVDAVSSDIEQARELLDRMATRHAKLSDLSARYVQERTSRLLAKPLVSRGELHFRSQPGCLIFRVASSGTVIRVDSKRYEVYRPEKKQLERFDMSAREWTGILFRTMSQQVKELLRTYDIMASEIDDRARRRIRFRARQEDEKKRLRVFEITVVPESLLISEVT